MSDEVSEENKRALDDFIGNGKYSLNNCILLATENTLVKINKEYLELEFSKVLLKYNCIDAADHISILTDLMECLEAK